MVLNVNTFQNIIKKMILMMILNLYSSPGRPITTRATPKKLRRSAVSGEPTTAYYSSLGRPFTTRTAPNKLRRSGSLRRAYYGLLQLSGTPVHHSHSTHKYVVRAVSGEPTTAYYSSLGRPFTTHTAPNKLRRSGQSQESLLRLTTALWDARSPLAQHPINYVVRAVSGEPYRYLLQPAISVATPVSPVQS